MRKHYRTCNLCEAMCGLEITLEDNKITSIKGDSDDPFSKGFICPKAVALQDIHGDPDRLKRPIKRTANGWEEISWNEAFDEVAQNLKSIRAEHGNNALGTYLGNPSVHNLGSMLFAQQLMKALRTKNRFSATSVDQLPHHFASQEMFGHLLLLPVPDIDHTEYFLVMGANPMASNGSMMTAAGMPDRIKALQKRGGKMIVIDPRCSETALKADEHHFIRPGSDVYFLGAMVHVLLKEQLVKLEELPEWMELTQDLGGIFDRFSPKKVTDITGISAKAIEKTARDFAGAGAAALYGRIGLSTQAHGTLCQWLINLINAITGNLDQKGGVMFTKPALDIVKSASSKSTMHRRGRWKSRVRGLEEFGSELPVAAMAEEILTPGKGQIKAMLVSAGNPVLSTPNGQELDKALGQLSYMVSIDIYLNETSRHANIILPPATGLEVPHYDIIFNNLAVRNVAKYSPPLFAPEKGSLYDWQIFSALTQRMGKPTFMERIMSKWLTPERMLNEGLRRGPYPISLKKLKQNPHGIDLGPLQPCLPERLFTPHKKVRLTPEVMVEALAKVPDVSSANGKLILIGRRELRSNNSWMHNSQRLIKGPERCTLMINPKDARKRGIEDGLAVNVTSRVGKVQLPAKVTEEMMPGVVSIPHGWGHHLDGINLNVARTRAGVSVNDLTDPQLLDPVSGNADLSGVPVEIEVLDQ